MFLILSLYNGESFENLKSQEKTSQTTKAVPYRRESFSTKDILIEFDAKFNRTDESFMQNQYLGKNLKDLQLSIDSMNCKLDSIRIINADNLYDGSYLKSFKAPAKENPDEKDSLLRAEVAPLFETESSPDTDFESIYQSLTPSGKASVLNRTKSAIENIRTDYYFRASTVGTEAAKIRRHMTEWHKKFTLSFACLVFFFIGAPLGAIIRKGGLGMPVVISVILFIFYYIIDNMGYKMARDGVWPAWQGMWLSSAVLTPMGIFLTYKAVKDSVILNADTYLNALKNIIGKRPGRKIERKEVIIYAPDYEAITPRLEQLAEDCAKFLAAHKRWLNYLLFWKNGGRDHAAEKIALEMEDIVEELSNSDQNLLLNKLMDYPIISGYQKLNPKLEGNKGLLFGLLALPISIPVYLLATYQRKLLRHDIQMIQKTSLELIEIINAGEKSDNKA